MKKGSLVNLLKFRRDLCNLLKILLEFVTNGKITSQYNNNII